MFEGLDPRIARIIRDTWLIVSIIQIVVVVFSLVRTLGFDVKKFNFGEDLHELQVDEEDNEEVEITTRFDADKVKMKAAMQREELKAFFYENKLMVILVLILLFVVIPSTFAARSYVVNKRYKVGEVIDLNKFNLKRKNTMYETIYIEKNKSNRFGVYFYEDATQWNVFKDIYGMNDQKLAVICSECIKNDAWKAFADSFENEDVLRLSEKNADSINDFISI